MKKILFLIPLIGICSSLLAQAPQVTNVQAEQVPGTKEVQVNFDLTGKVGSAFCFIEIWFKSESAQTQWQQVTSIFSDPASTNGLQELAFVESYDEFGNPQQGKAFTASAGEWAEVNKSFIWNAGEDVPDIQTADAQIRIIAFYPKVDEVGNPHPEDQQVSGWDGIGDFGGSGGTPDGNGTGPSVDVYVRDYADANNYYYSSFDPEWPNLLDRILYGEDISPVAPTAYFDEANQISYDVFELSDGLVLQLTGTNPPSGILLCAIVGDFLIPVMLQ